MQTVSIGDSLHEMTKPAFLIYEKNISNCRLLKILPGVPSVKSYMTVCFMAVGCLDFYLFYLTELPLLIFIMSLKAFIHFLSLSLRTFEQHHEKGCLWSRGDQWRPRRQSVQLWY